MISRPAGESLHVMVVYSASRSMGAASMGKYQSNTPSHTLYIQLRSYMQLILFWAALCSKAQAARSTARLIRGSVAAQGSSSTTVRPSAFQRGQVHPPFKPNQTLTLDLINNAINPALPCADMLWLLPPQSSNIQPRS